MTDTLLEVMARAVEQAQNDFDLDPPEEGESYEAWEKRRYAFITQRTLSALEAEGYVVVPVEPTDAMLAAVRWENDDAYEGWSAMLSAREPIK